MNRFKSVDFFQVEMASQTDTALDQLNHINNTAFSTIERFKPFDRYTDHQLQDGLVGQQEPDRMRFIVMKLWGELWNWKLRIHMIEKESTQLSDVIGHVISMMLRLYLEGIITRSLFFYVCTHLYLTRCRD